ncbi:GntR family transcriptional regulator [Nocardiopsis composta]|uniref:GntR family transcriptional regulator n=1 Tax=Nocardiopsis composta TaxID=157465 RepID=A0A7W8VFV6_9ACTN|nr:GntR family transcriptional regulator [Nocardiopsis composta]MBB5434515.1 GntR family transcriptional regulator [Nocardiopsis composta]
MREESRYRQIARTLRREIEGGELPPGARVSSEKELEERFQASRNTVRLALGMLRNQGLVASHPGKGHFVQRVLPITYYANRPSGGSGSGIEFSAFTAGSKVSELLIESATAEIASRLRIPEGERVVVRRTSGYVEDRCTMRRTSYYPMDIAQGSPIMHPAPLPDGAAAVLAELGHPQVGNVDELQTRMPAPEEAEDLRLPQGVPVLELYRTGYSESRPIVLEWVVFAGNGTRFQYEIGDLGAYRRD